MNHRLATTFSVIGIALCTGCLTAGEPPRILELRTQKVEGTTYFHVQLDRPADLRLPGFDTSKPFSERDRRNFARLPQLIPQDDKTRTVYYRHRPTQPGLSFCGQLKGGKARLLLLYPLAEPVAEKAPALAELMRSASMAEATVELDFDKARAVAVPKIDPEDQHINRDDLRTFWALHQAAHFAVLESQVVDFNFYSFAREATGRKYNVMAPAWIRRQTETAEHRLYEITTGAEAIAETLQLHRLLRVEPRPEENRTEDILDLEEITAPKPPWGRMLGDEKPAVESIARLVPHDNYYVHFKNVRKFLEFGELLDQWGTSVLRVYEMKSRDAQLRQRYEKQLCLKSTMLGKLLGPAVIKRLVVTGHDPYVREGTDVTVLFEVANAAVFRTAVESFIKEARQEHGDRLREGHENYQGTKIETFVTPLREVSLHRATLGDFVIYSNSPAGVRRVIDVQRKALKCLADADDFRYLRTLFPLDDEKEEGFVYLSDAFIRQLVSPASRIKEKRRLEALTSLSMITNAGLFCAWETGEMPNDLKTALAGAGLRRDDVAMPEAVFPDAPDKSRGRVYWNSRHPLAVSDAYNTIHFATPLIELPIDRITPAEKREYKRFRDEYAKLWQSYFDPIGMRLSLDNNRVRVETHILPLSGTEQYQTLRNVAGHGTFRFQPRKGALLDVQFNVGDNRNELAIGLQVDGDKLLHELVDRVLRLEMEPRSDLRRQYDQLFWKLPFGISFRGTPIKDNGAKTVVDVLKLVQLIDGEVKVSRHKDVQIQRLPISQEKYRELAAVLNEPSAVTEYPFLALLPTQEAPAALHAAMIGETLHVSASEDFIKQRIDEAAARKKVKDKKPAEASREANAGLYFAPANARQAASLFLEYEGHNLALLNNQVWNCFYQAGILKRDAAENVRRDTVRQFLSSIPVSPDGSTYRYDARRAEVLNARHGSLLRPEWHDQVAEDSELGQLLKQIKALRVELRFRDNGLHTVLTIERK